MTERERAEEHLLVIRSLLERATIYRTVSLPMALAGGLLALSGGVWLAQHPVAPATGTACWVGLAAALGILNTVCLWREARRRHEPFVSSGMKVALRSLGPSFLLAAAITLQEPDGFEWLPLLWSSCYALGLLATGHFAPHSMVWLGRAFLLGSILGASWAFHHTFNWTASQYYMALTFGLFHLLYAAGVWWKRRAS